MTLLSDVIGESPGITAIRDTIGRLLRRHSGTRRLPPVLIQGETGTGKGLLARGLHRAGPRATGPFVDVNCAAIPGTLVEAEMLGFERGAFTDARQAKPGLFQAAHQGTIFLDEVGLLPEGVQSKLLKVIEEREVRRLGSTRSEPIDAWILTATSEDLLTATRERRFREDLYHRMAVLTIWLPPLRERGRDVLLLAEHFLARACADYELPQKRLTEGACAALLQYAWPGNVRELANVMERVALLSEAAEVTAAVLGLPGSAARLPEKPKATAAPRLSELEWEAERERLLEVLTRTRWNILRAAAALGVPRNTLRYRLEKHGLRPSDASAHRQRREPGPGSVAARPGPLGVRWQRRRLSLLRATLSGEPHGADLPADGSRPFEVLLEKLLSFGGRIEELSPRGIMAAFGVEPVEDAPTRAALAAMTIQRAATRAQPRDVGRFGVKLALHVGRFMLGQVGDRTAIDLDAKQDAWTILDELLLRAEPNSVLVSGASVPFLERRFDLVAVAPTLLGQPAYRLGRFDLTGLRHGGRLATFVGRRPERALLQRRLDAVRRGQGQLVGIAGDPGIGKSRLLYETRQDLSGQGVSCLEARCLSYATTVPYLPVLDMLRATCAITDTDSPEAIAEKVRAALAALSLEERTAAPLVLQLLGLAPPADTPGARSAEEMKARTYEVLREMILRQSRQRPLVLVVEDVHWMDRTSEEFFASLADAVAAVPVLIVTTYRPGYRPPWRGKSYATEMALQPLALDDSLALVRSVLGGARTGRQFEELIVAKGEGNPFFLEELAWAARELEQDGHAQALVVPDTVEEVLLARIDRLPAAERSLLQACAIIGREVPVALLQAVTEMPAEELRDSLSTLRTGEFLLETDGIEPGYTFKHALTHDVAYASLSPERRRALHGEVLAAIERLAGPRGSEQAEARAYHAVRAELWDRSVDALREAGTAAYARGAIGPSLERLEQALELLPRLPTSADSTRRAIDVRLSCTPLLARGQIARLGALLREAEPLARDLHDQIRLIQVLRRLGGMFLHEGLYARAAEYEEEVLRLATARGDAESRLGAANLLGQAQGALGRYREAVAGLQAIADGADAEVARIALAGSVPVHAATCASLGWLHAAIGQFDLARRYADRGVESVEVFSHPAARVNVGSNRALVDIYQGRFDAAIPALEKTVREAEVHGLSTQLPAAYSFLGSALTGAGRAVEGLPHLARGVTGNEQIGSRFYLARRYMEWAEGLLLTGELQDAHRAADTALSLARATGERGTEAETLRVLGAIAAAGSPPDPEMGAMCYQQGLTLASELGMRPLVAHCHLALGKLYRGNDDRTHAEEHLATATTMYREMDMTHWLPQAEALLQQIG